MKQDEYYFYCTTHNKSVLPEDRDKHELEDCNFIITHFDWTPPRLKRKDWVAKSVVKKEGMIVYRYKSTPKVPNNTLPIDAVRLDTPDFIPRKL